MKILPLTDNNNSEKSVVVLGKGPLAIKVCKWILDMKGFNLKLIVPVVPEPEWAESLIKFAQINKIQYIKSGNIHDLDEVVKVDEIDLYLSIFFETILKSNFIKRCNRIINFHPSPLPKYRGVKPINWFLKDHEADAEAIFSITLLEIDENIDSGALISQVSFPIYPKYDEVKDVFEKCLDYGYLMIVDALIKLDIIVPKQQNEEHASIFYKKDNHLLGERLTFTKELSLRNIDK